MFSSRERDFLAALVRCDAEGDLAQRELIAAFPNPTYRRKILWGIRRKALGASADWELYLRAARAEPKVLPAPVPPEAIPLAADPLVTLGRTIRGYLRSKRRPVHAPDGRSTSAARSEIRK
jgi:hypothetical protein